jgi:hypothetical protein
MLGMPGAVIQDYEQPQDEKGVNTAIRAFGSINQSRYCLITGMCISKE